MFSLLRQKRVCKYFLRSPETTLSTVSGSLPQPPKATTQSPTSTKLRPALHMHWAKSWLPFCPRRTKCRWWPRMLRRRRKCWQHGQTRPVPPPTPTPVANEASSAATPAMPETEARDETGESSISPVAIGRGTLPPRCRPQRPKYNPHALAPVDDKPHKRLDKRKARREPFEGALGAWPVPRAAAHQAPLGRPRSSHWQQGKGMASAR